MIPLIRFNCDYLQQGIELLEKHDSESFVQTDSQAFGSSIGSHLRHVLDHYKSFLGAIDTGIVDYDNRLRNTDSESDIEVAKSELQSVIDKMAALEGVEDRSVKVKVSSSVSVDEDEVSDSSLAREMQFLVSHTVHHYALIAIISRIGGVEPNASFGVAPSTLKYLQSVSS